jgi:GT2 family glycosyltransferase
MNVEFIVPTFDRIHPLKCMLESLMAQTNPNWCATVVIDNSEKEAYCYAFTEDYYPKVRFIFSGKRYNDWGHTPREIGKQQSEADYIILTNDDNYYTPNFVDELMKAAVDKPGIIYWDMVHSYYNYSHFKCKPFYNQIDMGAFATRRDMAQSVHMKTDFAADGLFINELIEKYPQEKIVKINKILFIHN